MDDLFVHHLFSILGASPPTHPQDVVVHQDLDLHAGMFDVVPGEVTGKCGTSSPPWMQLGKA